ncbi:fibrinogen-like protein A [Crassostrea angulata]|uniref:fibrinogen-like protein A n=1 Tax=Magallana angulata TaxID=2784310 RepID=UPI0022B17AEA|nr:fibrinogen-like protein A [Crassostrea angulata]
MDQFSIFQLLNLLCVFPLISMMIKEIVEREQKYVLTQPHETATSEVCVLKEVFVRNGSSAKIQCGAECNKVFVGRCKFVDVIKGDRPMCRLISGFKTPENVSPGHPSGQFVRFKKVDAYYNSFAIGRDSLCTVSLATGRTIPSLCHYGEHNWTIIQRRLDGSVNFRRNWREYEDGFGTFDSEYWIGNKNLHYLTSDGLTYLRVEMMMQTCEWRYADYGQFIVKSATDKYRLFVANYSGNAGDSFYYHNNAQFSTYDYDHDTSYSNCADRCKGGWWYTKCHLVNLNGEYANTNFLEGINWHAMTGFTYSLKEVRMMLRRP